MWDIKHRPLKFSDALGQTGAVQLLKSRLKNGTALDTSYIFSGGHGRGKTTLARIHARAALCLDLNKDDPEPCNVCDNCTAMLAGEPGAFEERDAASGGTIDIVRSMVDDLPFAILNAPKRVWLFDEAHRMSIGAQDVLLKPLEEKKVVGIFCTTEAEKIRGPIRSRCEEHTIRTVSREDVLARMKMILDLEGVVHEDDAVLTVIDASGGHIRDVINKLEMISQLGDITIGNVREYLNLGVVSVYYNVLLSLGTNQAIELVESACERVSPDEVAAGLAEAAMNSYRLANGMFADFVYVDRALAHKVFERFGAQTLKLAEFFLRSKYPSRTGLICDVVGLAQGVPTTIAAPAPIQITVSAPVVAPVTPSANLTAAGGGSAPEQSVVPSAPLQQPQQAPVPSPAVSSSGSNGKLRPDGIGARGSGDVQALTDEDHKGVPSGWPRTRSTFGGDPVIPFVPGVTIDDENRVLSPDEWKREFDRTWPQPRR